VQIGIPDYKVWLEMKQLLMKVTLMEHERF
jgi:hypothetical protein